MIQVTNNTNNIRIRFKVTRNKLTHILKFHIHKLPSIHKFPSIHRTRNNKFTHRNNTIMIWQCCYLAFNILVVVLVVHHRHIVCEFNMVQTKLSFA